MGQQNEYLNSDEHWHYALSLESRLDRWPVQSSFAIDIGDRASEAVDKARDGTVLAEHVFAQAKEQAVYALLLERQSVRAIAAVTGIPKSEVGRIAAQVLLSRLTGGDPPRTTILPTELVVRASA